MRKRQWGFLAVLILAAMFLFFGESPAADDLPDDSAAARKLVETYISTNADTDAVNLLVKIISSDSFKDINDWAIIEYYGLAQKMDGITPAIAKLKVIAKKSNSIGLQRGIAEGNVRLGDWDKVAEVYENLLKENPGDSIFSTRLIDAYMLTKNYNGVIEILEPKVTANPNDNASSDVLAQAYVGAQKLDEAVALYNKKIAKEPNSPGLRGRYAQGLMDLGMLEESLAEWNMAFQLDPRNFLFKQRQAEIYMQMGNIPEAKKEYSELLGLIPADQNAFKETIASRIKDIEAGEKK